MRPEEMEDETPSSCMRTKLLREGIKRDDPCRFIADDPCRIIADDPCCTLLPLLSALSALSESRATSTPSSEQYEDAPLVKMGPRVDVPPAWVVER
mmetsp:Transcript_37804/g.75771  ORF Transcript_37804/g.75771 Transcript_37804/m.75771 type:complete len:96 (+) Transcript_37804:366-653(+)